MKHDVFIWNEGSDYEKNPVEGVFRLRASAPGALYCQGEGFESLVGYGTSFEVETASAVTFLFVPDSGKARTFWWRPQLVVSQPDAEVFTNIDRMVDESGTVSEVKKALRAFELERRAILGQIRSDAYAAAAAKALEGEVVEKAGAAIAASVPL